MVYCVFCMTDDYSEVLTGVYSSEDLAKRAVLDFNNRDFSSNKSRYYYHPMKLRNSIKE